MPAAVRRVSKKELERIKSGRGTLVLKREPKRKQISKAELERMRSAEGTRVLTKATREAESAATGLDAEAARELLQAHERVMAEVHDIREALSESRTWPDMRWKVKRTEYGFIDRLEVSSVSGASAVFHVERDGEYYITGLSVERSEPELSLDLKVIRDNSNVLQEVVSG